MTFVELEKPDFEITFSQYIPIALFTLLAESYYKGIVLFLRIQYMSSHNINAPNKISLAINITTLTVNYNLSNAISHIHFESNIINGY